MGKFIFTTPAPPYIMCLSWFMGNFFFLLSWLRHSRRKIPSLFLHIKGLGHFLKKSENLACHQHMSKSIPFCQLDRKILFLSSWQKDMDFGSPWWQAKFSLILRKWPFLVREMNFLEKIDRFALFSSISQKLVKNLGYFFWLTYIVSFQ